MNNKEIIEELKLNIKVDRTEKKRTVKLKDYLDGRIDAYNNCIKLIKYGRY